MLKISSVERNHQIGQQNENTQHNQTPQRAKLGRSFFRFFHCGSWCIYGLASARVVI